MCNTQNLHNPYVTHLHVCFWEPELHKSISGWMHNHALIHIHQPVWTSWAYNAHQCSHTCSSLQASVAVHTDRDALFPQQWGGAHITHSPHIVWILILTIPCDHILSTSDVLPPSNLHNQPLTCVCVCNTHMCMCVWNHHHHISRCKSPPFQKDIFSLALCIIQKTSSSRFHPKPPSSSSSPHRCNLTLASFQLAQETPHTYPADRLLPALQWTFFLPPNNTNPKSLPRS